MAAAGLQIPIVPQKGLHQGLSRASELWLVFVLTLVAMLAAVDRQILALLINPIRADLELTDTQMSLIVGAAFALANIACTLPAGYIADRKSARLLILGGGWFWSTMTMACGLAGNFVQMFLARAGVGVGEASIHPGALSILRKAIPAQRRGRAFSIYYMSLMVGAALALLAGGFLVGTLERNETEVRMLVGDFRPWQLTLMIVGALGIPISALMLTVRVPSGGVTQTDVEESSYKIAIAYVRENWRLFAPLWISHTAFMLMTAGFAGWLAAMMQRRFDVSAETVGLMLGSGMLIMPQLGLLISGRLIDKVGAKRGLRGVAVVGAFATGGFWIGATIVPHAQTQFTFLAVVYISFMVSQAPMPVFATLLAELTPAHMMGKMTSIQLIITGLFGAALGPTVVAVVSDAFFSGPTAIARALSLVSLGVGWIPVIGLLVLGRRAQTRLKTDSAGSAQPIH